MKEHFSIKGGLGFPVALRHYGVQDRGVSPQGAQDQLSFSIAYKLLDKPSQFQAVEMIYPSKIIANQDLYVVITGASYETTKVGIQDVVYNQVFEIRGGETIDFSGIKKGFRTIIIAIEANLDSQYLLGNKRSQELDDYIKQNYKNNVIRVLRGPEYNILRDNSFFENTWSISSNSSQMGLSLDGPTLDTQQIEMISQPVADGTIQLAPSGPIVLMRHRQTVGGYPRIANAIEPDLNKLSQFAPGAKIRFVEIELEKANIEKMKIAQLLS
ncbi:hydrolase [Candidatus Francisella endociliophora]|uniref:Hydrolase n=1 Tax=Candidatus Francisella endociliophora TaxID=653937 RepID=A0A097EQ11_9GAMM|nr:hydrolase [Francisella sp. FSC1006]AIT09664.1 hydrolase [Francisella sp. FSC1006]